MTLRKAMRRWQAKIKRSRCKGVTNPTGVRCVV